MKPFFIFLLFTIVISQNCLGQETSCDSLKKLADSAYHVGGSMRYIINIYSKMISLGCDSITRNLNNRGSMYNSLEEYDSAYADLTRAYSIDSTDGSVLANLGVTYSYFKNYDSAELFLAKAIYHYPKSAMFYKLLADICVDSEDYVGAEKNYKKSVELNRHYIAGQEGLIVLYKWQVRQIKPDSAEYDSAVSKVVNAYTSAMADNPDYPFIRVERGNFYHSIGLDDKAITDYSVYLKNTPQSFRTFVDRGLAYEMLGEYDKALQDYTASIAAKENYLAYYNRARLYHKWYNNNEKAIKDNLKCIELAPGYATAYLNLGNCYLDLKKYDKAKDAYEKGMANNPDADTKSKLKWQLDAFK